MAGRHLLIWEKGQRGEPMINSKGDLEGSRGERRRTTANNDVT